MRGAQRAKILVAAYLKEDLPLVLPPLRTAWGLDEQTLPVPDDVTPNALLLNTFVTDRADRGCRVAVTVADSPARANVGRPGGGVLEYRTTYSARVWVWVKATGWDRTQQIRDDLTSAVVVSLLRRPSLGHPDEAGLDEGTLRESYSELTAVNGDRFVAGAFVAFTLALEQRLGNDLPGDYLGTPGGPNAVQADWQGYPADHPAFD